MAPLDTRSSGNNEESNFTRKPLNGAALAAAALLSAGAPNMTIAQENYTDGVNTARTATKQKTADLTGQPGFPTEGAGKGTAVNPLGLAKGKFESDGNHFDFGVENSSQFGIIVRGDVARMITDNIAIDVEIAGGKKHREALVKAGFKISENMVARVTWHELQQLMSFDFESGKDSTWVGQKTLGATLRIKSDKKWLDFLEVNGYISKADSKQLEKKNFIVDTATLTSLWEDQRRIAGTTKAGLSGSAKIRVGDNDTVQLTLGAEYSKEDTLVPSASKLRATGGAIWEHKFNEEYSTSVGVSTAGPTTSVRLAGNKKTENGTFSVFAQQNMSKDGIGGSGGKNSTTVGVMMNIVTDPIKGNRVRNVTPENTSNQASLSPQTVDDTPKTVSYSEWQKSQLAKNPNWNFDSHKQTVVASNTLKSNNASDINGFVPDTSGGSAELIAFMKERVGYNPTVVQASIDRTATKRLIAELDKTSLPAGATMDENGNIDIPAGMALGTFTSGTNTTSGAPIPASVFVLNGSNLRISTSALKPFLRANSSATNMDTVTLVTSTATITFKAYIGSVHIKDLNVVANAPADVLAPTTSAAPSISTAATDTTASVSQTINENGTGYYLVLPAASPAPTKAAVLAGTSFAMTANTPAVVNLTGLTANTAYKYYFVAKDAATTPNVQAAVSAGLAITTAVAEAPPVMGDVPDQTGTIGTAFSLNVASSVTLTNGDTVTSYALASGSLPPGLGLNTTTGVISGTPTTAGTYNITVTATDNDGLSNADTVQFVISAAPDVLAPSTPATLTLTGNAGAVAGYTNTQNITLAVADVTDVSGVSWFVSESSSAPAAGAGGWSGTKPTSFTLSAGDGTKNVYVYVKDNAATPNVQATGKTTSIMLDTVAPSKTGESLASLDTGGGNGTGSLSFGEAVHSVTSISFKKTADNSPAAGSISVSSGLDTTTLNLSWTAPNLTLEDVYITAVVVDNAGNSRTITSGNYTLF